MITEHRPTEVTYIPSPTAYSFHMSNADTRMVMGPVGSGKSTMSILELIRLAAGQAPDKYNKRSTRWLIVRETYPQLRNTVWESFKLWLKPNEATCRYTESAPMRIRWTDRLGDGTLMNAEFIFMAISKPQDYENLKSLELTGAFINEGGYMDFDVVTTVLSRIGRYPAPVDAVDVKNPITRTALLIDSNPPDEDGWMAQKFKQPPPGWDLWRQPGAVIEDPSSELGYALNPKGENFDYIGIGPKKYYLDKVGAMTKEQVKVLFMGDFGVTSNGKAVYRRQWMDDIHVFNGKLGAVPGYPILLGWDWGKGGEACIIAQKTNSGQLRVLREIVADNIGLHDFARTFVRPYLEKYYPSPKWEIISVGDPSGIASHGLSKDSLNYFDVLNNSKDGIFADWFETRPAKSNHIELRLNAVRFFLSETTEAGNPKFVLDKTECSRLRRGFNAGYAYKRKQVTGEAQYKDVPDKNDFSHPHDGLQYICLEAHPKYKELVKHTSFVTRSLVDGVTNY